jgi:hypothetical protein
VVIDNLKAGVLMADWYDPELTPKLEGFAHHFGTVILPTKPRTPKHKGKGERGIDYAQENVLKGMTFASLHEQNVHLRHWESTVEDTRYMPEVSPVIEHFIVTINPLWLIFHGKTSRLPSIAQSSEDCVGLTPRRSHLLHYCLDLIKIDCVTDHEPA